MREQHTGINVSLIEEDFYPIFMGYNGNVDLREYLFFDPWKIMYQYTVEQIYISSETYIRSPFLYVEFTCIYTL